MIIRTEVGVINDLVDSLGCLVDEARIRVNGEGVRSRVVDAANVALTDVDVGADAFSRLEIDGERELGMKIDKLSDVVSMAQSSDEPISIKLTDSQKLDISMPESGFQFTTALIDPDAIRQEPDLPDLDLPGEFVIRSSELSRGLRAADLVADRIAVSAISSDELKLSASGDMDDVELSLDDELIDAAFQSSDAARSVLSLDYLNDIETPIPNDTEVRLLMGDEFPIKLHYRQRESIAVECMIAPRIESQ